MATTITTKGVLYINDKQVENSFKNITSITRKLQGELKKLPIGTKAFQEKAEELKRAQTRFQDLRNEIYGVRGALNKTGNVFTRFLGSIGANIGILSFSGYSRFIVQVSTDIDLATR